MVHLYLSIINKDVGSVIGFGNDYKYEPVTMFVDLSTILLYQNIYYYYSAFSPSAFWTAL